MSLILSQLDLEVTNIVKFLHQTFQDQNKTKAVIAVSGGIDSAVSLTLLTKALGPENIYPVLLPFQDQDMTDAVAAVVFNKIAPKQVTTLNIESLVTEFAEQLGLTPTDAVRVGNIKARTRMIVVFDLAKKLDALVCGTENKSEHFLGYFTRFGDAASDLEPISHLYKTQVRQVAEFLQLPEQLSTKAPSAGLWAGQSDEAELGFSYREADLVLYRLLDLKQSGAEIQIPGISETTISKVIERVEQMHFKHQVPYTLTNA